MLKVVRWTLSHFVFPVPGFHSGKDNVECRTQNQNCRMVLVKDQHLRFFRLSLEIYLFLEKGF